MTEQAIRFLVIGFLLGNGMPHFAFGAAGKIFRTPFGRQSSPRLNVGWGLANFLVATVLVWFLADTAPQPVDVAFLLAGFWLAVLMFGTSIKHFLNDSKK